MKTNVNHSETDLLTFFFLTPLPLHSSLRPGFLSLSDVTRPERLSRENKTYDIMQPLLMLSRQARCAAPMPRTEQTLCSGSRTHGATRRSSTKGPVDVRTSWRIWQGCAATDWWWWRVVVWGCHTLLRLLRGHKGFFGCVCQCISRVLGGVEPTCNFFVPQVSTLEMLKQVFTPKVSETWKYFTKRPIKKSIWKT